MSPGAPRLAPIPVEQWGDDERAAIQHGFPGAAPRILSTGPDALPPSNAVCTMMHHPALAGAYLAYNAVLLEKPALGHRLRELIVLRVASRTGSTYEWAQHVRLAASAGMTAEEIDAVKSGTGADLWKPLEADLLAATDQLIDTYRIEDDTWTRLAQELDQRQLVEVVFIAGTYTGLAMAFNSLGIQLDPDLQEK